MSGEIDARDPWAALRAATPARIGLERCGDGLPTQSLLDFQLAHARARDAVHGAVDFAALAARIEPLLPVLRVKSAVPDRAAYLRRPDLGRRLAPDSRALLQGDGVRQRVDAVFVIADGLSAAAVETQAAPLLECCLALLPHDWALAPAVLAEQARVGLGDEICALLNADLCAVLIGERPGLSAADSLGVYLTWRPSPGHKDSDRNCLSNIHGRGLSIDQAAAKLVWLMTEARRRQVTGIALKENAGAAALPKT